MLEYSDYMLTLEQERWLLTLSDSDSTHIVPYDPLTEIRFEKLQEKLHTALSENHPVVLRGSSSLKIAGQGELDVYVPVHIDMFEKVVKDLAGLLGAPKSVHPLERVRFVTYIQETKAEVFVINKDSKGWVDGCRFEEYLKKNPDALREYEQCKMKAEGLSMRDYYRKKIEFINTILRCATMEAMIDEEQLVSLLRGICPRLSEKKVRYHLDGSANLFVQGMNVTVGDLDITTDEMGIEICREIFAEYVVKDFYSEKISGTSLLLNIEHCEIEINSYGDREEETLQYRTNVAWRGVTVCCLPLKWAQKLYEKQGRKEKATMIEHFISKK